MAADDRIAEIDAKILKLSFLSLPGPILTALALLGKYGEPGEIPFEFLNDAALTTVLLVIGIAFLLGTGYFIVKLGVAKARAEMEKERNS